MSEPVTVFGFKETMTISEQHGAILKATFTVVNPEQISKSPSDGDNQLDLNKVTFFKKDGEYKLIEGSLEEVLAQNMDKLVDKQTVTISLGLNVRDCHPKTFSNKQVTRAVSSKALPQTSEGLNGVQNILKTLRLKALAARASFG